MNASIKELNDKISKSNQDIADIESQLQTEWDKVFNDITSITKAVSRLQSSDEYAWDEFGEVVQWISFNDLSDFKECKQYFTNYMQENHCVNVDWTNDTLTNSVGPSIVINDIGEVLDQDSGKWILNASDYENEEGESDESKRNELIEAHMEKTGYFPGVYRMDRHGNVFAVKTQK